MMILKISAAALLLAASVQAQLLENIQTGCAPEGEVDPTIDYFPVKYEPPSIFTYNTDTDIFGQQFTPHNTTDLLDIEYFGTYKIIYNRHNNVSYLLYQCGTTPPQDEVDSGAHHLVIPVPHRGGIAITQTPQIPPMELLGLREEIIGYIGNPIYVTSPCMNHMMEEGDIEVVYDELDPWNSTNSDALRAAFVEKHPDVLIFGGPLDEAPFHPRTINVAASQERTNVATFDWIALYAALYNMEGFSNKISSETQARYDCTSTNARLIVQKMRERRLAEEAAVVVDEERQLEGHTANNTEDDMSPKHPGDIKIFWASYLFGYNWSVALCDTWDAAYYCEYATHCGAEIISRPPDMGYFLNFGGPTNYYYLNDDEILSIGKDADIWIFPDNRWDEVYALKNETLDQFKAVQNKQVYDNQGSGSNAWFEQRLAEYDVVGLDMCDLVGTANPNGPPHQRRWFRNIFTEPIGSLPACNIPDELTEPYVPQGAECELLLEEDFEQVEDNIVESETDGEATGEETTEEVATEETIEEETTEETTEEVTTEETTEEVTTEETPVEETTEETTEAEPTVEEDTETTVDKSGEDSTADAVSGAKVLSLVGFAVTLLVTMISA